MTKKLSDTLNRIYNKEKGGIISDQDKDFVQGQWGIVTTYIREVNKWLLQEKIKEQTKETIDYIKQRDAESFGLDGQRIGNKQAEIILETVAPEGDRENTIREQAYLLWLKDALDYI